MFFDLQRFGGKGGTTIQSTYEPTIFELTLQRLEVELTEEVLIPSAKKLGQTAYDSFESANVNVQDITNNIHNFWEISQRQIDVAFDGLTNSQEYLANSIATLDSMLDDIPVANAAWDRRMSELSDNYEFYIDDQNDNASFANKQIKELPDKLSINYDDLENNLDDISGFFENGTVPSGVVSKMTYNLSNISTENYKDLDELKPTLESALEVEFEDALDGIDNLTTLGSFYNNLDSLIPEYNNNYHYAIYGEKASLDSDKKIVAWIPDPTAVTNFNELLKGKLPEQWKTNMKEAIKTTLENTIGEVVNDLSSRGVINSSVATQALYDIERNASDEVAKQYLQNIQSVGGLVQNRWQVKEQSLNDQKLVLNELWGYMAQAFGLKLQAKAHDAENKRAVALALAQIFTQQFSNSSNAFTQQTGIATQKNSAFINTTKTQAQLYGELLDNQNKASVNAMNWYQIAKSIADTEWAHNLSNLEQLTRMYQLRLQTVGTWNNTWESVLANSGRKIALSAAAQEALQQPAMRLWNASTGLNQSATGVLVALSNQGTRTQTQSSSGNFLGGVLSAGLTAFTGGWGVAAGSALFGQKQNG